MRLTLGRAAVGRLVDASMPQLQTGWLRQTLSRALTVVALTLATVIPATTAAQSPAPSRPSAEATAPASPSAPRVPAGPAGATPKPAQSAESALASAVADYRIGTHDLLELQVFGVDQLNRTVRVNSSGLITLPLIGAVEVGGKTSHEAEAVISAKLSEKYLQNPQVSLYIKEFTSQRVTVEGAVKKPGIYPLAGQTSLLRAIALAGGQDQLSDMSEVMIFRINADNGTRKGTQFDVEKIRRGQLEDPLLVNDDVVVVNRSPTRVTLRDSVFRDVLDFFNPFKR
jgi:polysaccharide biosynthesis/export protein